MAVKYDPILNKIRQKDIIPQLDSDPTSPKPQEAWVKRTVSGTPSGGGEIKAFLGLGFPYLTTGTGGLTYTYALSYRTKEGTTKRVTLS